MVKRAEANFHRLLNMSAISPDSQGFTLLCALFILVGCMGSAPLEAGSVQPRNTINAAMKSLLCWFLPTSTYLLIGVGLAEWPLKIHAPVAARALMGTTLILSGGILSLVLSERLRLQPFVLSLLALCGFVLPLGLAIEELSGVLQWPFRDAAHLGMISAMTAAFALSGPTEASSIAKDRIEISFASDFVRATQGQILLCVGWIAAAVGIANSSQEASNILIALLVAGGCATILVLLVSWAYLGTATPQMLLRSGLAGIIAALPVANSLPAERAALVGSLGALAAEGLHHAFGRLRIHDPMRATSIHLGSAMVGLLVAPFLCSSPPRELSTAILQLALGSSFPALGLLVGFLFWSALGLVVRVQLSPEELDAGLDFTEHRHSS